MKYLFATIIMLVSFSCCIASCGKDNSEIPTQNNTSDTTEYNSDNNNDTTNNSMRITVGTAVFTATLNNNTSAAAFKKMLPLTIGMRELNGNEKFYYFPTILPTNTGVGGNIKVGDLMLYGNNCLVLFYEDFNTSYSYTRLGRIYNVSGLAAALGSGSVTVKFEMR